MYCFCSGSPVYVGKVIAKVACQYTQQSTSQLGSLLCSGCALALQFVRAMPLLRHKSPAATVVAQPQWCTLRGVQKQAAILLTLLGPCSTMRCYMPVTLNSAQLAAPTAQCRDRLAYYSSRLLPHSFVSAFMCSWNIVPRDCTSGGLYSLTT